MPRREHASEPFRHEYGPARRRGCYMKDAALSRCQELPNQRGVVRPDDNAAPGGDILPRQYDTGGCCERASPGNDTLPRQSETLRYANQAKR